MRISVLGAGNWGTTVAMSIAAAGHSVQLWSRSETLRDEINQQRENSRYLPGVKLSEAIRASADLAEVTRGAQLLFIIIPSKAFRRVAEVLGEQLQPDQLVIHGTKGFEPGTQKRMSQILQEETCARQLGVLSGPNIAWEMARGLPSGTTIASRFPRVIASARQALEHKNLLVYGHHDLLGVELAGALKNIVAIAAGMAEAMEVGQNAKALLITRGMAEITRLGVALGAEPQTFQGMAGMGDLIVTCSSTRSRNFRVGRGLALGQSLPQILDELGMVAEGINTARITATLLKSRKIPAPLLSTIAEVIQGGLSPQEGLHYLMSLSGEADVERF